MFQIDNGVLLEARGIQARVAVPPGVTRIAPGVFRNRKELLSVSLPAGLTEIGEDAFYGCEALREVVLPDGLRVIGDDAFGCCRALADVALPGTLAELGDGAFAWSGLKSVCVPGGVRHIPASAFAGCGSLLAAQIAPGCESVGDGAFAGCPSLVSVRLPQTVTSIGERAFRNDGALTDVILPDALLTLGASAFSGCSSLEELRLPDGLTEIKERSFDACAALRRLRFPQMLTAIGAYAFRRCESLRELAFPTALKTIGDNAFISCLGLLSVSFGAPPEEVGRTAFYDTEVAVPEGIRRMYCTSFLRRESGACPEIRVPASVTSLDAGFENLIGYGAHKAGDAAQPAVLWLERYGARVFLGKKYYRAAAGGGAIMRGAFDFDAYDEMLPLADEDERPLVAACRLAYPAGLRQAAARRYRSALQNAAADAAFWATRRGETGVLCYLLSSYVFDGETYRLLHDTAMERKQFDLARELVRAARKNRPEEDIFSRIAFDLSPEPAGWTCRTHENGTLVLETFTGDAESVSLPLSLKGERVGFASETLFAGAAVRAVETPEPLRYPGGGLSGAVVTLRWCGATLYIPREAGFRYGSYIYKGEKYFDFEWFDEALLQSPTEQRLRAMAYRLAYPVNLSQENRAQFSRLLNGRADAPDVPEETDRLRRAAPSPRYTEDYLAGLRREEAQPEGFTLRTANGGRTVLGFSGEGKTAVLPEYVRAVARGACAALSAQTVVLPDRLRRVYPQAFENAAVSRISVSDQTSLPGTLFPSLSADSSLLLRNAEGETEEIPFPRSAAPQTRELAGFLFSGRYGADPRSRFPFAEYDLLPLTGEALLARSYARIGSRIRPHPDMDAGDVRKCLALYAGRGEREKLSFAVKNGYVKQEDFAFLLSLPEDACDPSMKDFIRSIREETI